MVPGNAPRGRTSASLRSANLALILREVIRAETPPSRAGLAQALGMTRSTVSRLVDELVDGGFLREGEAISVGRGRPAVPLSANPARFVALGIEVNVDRTVMTLSNLNGDEILTEQVARSCVELGAKGALPEIAQDAITLLEQLGAEAELVGIQMAVPGLVDRSGRTVLSAPNLRWDGARPEEHLDVLLERHPVPFRVCNDVDAGALTVLKEIRTATNPHPSFIYLTGDFGIGSGLISSGDPLTGTHGWSGEIGHACVDPHGSRCGCGAYGCLETVAGVRALLEASGAESLQRLEALLEEEDSRALQTMAAVGRALGIALGGALNLIDMTRVVLGGYLATLYPWIEAALHQELEQRVLWAPYFPFEITCVENSGSRASRGAALRALSLLLQDPAAWLGRSDGDGVLASS